MTLDKNYFSKLERVEIGIVRLGDGRPCPIEGVRSMMFKLHNG